ncbi:Hypothetical protein NTJ_11833 [Nesidiocoris tenuis]|uniref:Uncharacterized protein n=1 Tax=Nesidiocoris tenuis TaxID=355587 RepID=A0ABN7B5X0_9HEMI|nr:Hypothetical protein NTJ_11833 [Nesidiocoris tenuis]
MCSRRSRIRMWARAVLRSPYLGQRQKKRRNHFESYVRFFLSNFNLFHVVQFTWCDAAEMLNETNGS